MWLGGIEPLKYVYHGIEWWEEMLEEDAKQHPLAGSSRDFFDIGEGVEPHLRKFNLT